MQCLFICHIVETYMSETIPDIGHGSGTKTGRMSLPSQESRKGLLKEEILSTTWKRWTFESHDYVGGRVFMLKEKYANPWCINIPVDTSMESVWLLQALRKGDNINAYNLKGSDHIGLCTAVRNFYYFYF